MKDQFVTYEIAVKLKELGFNEPCFAYYTEFNGKTELSFKVNYQQVYDIGSFIETEDSGLFPLPIYNKNYYVPSAPLWQQVFDWFLVNHELLGTCKKIEDNNQIFYYPEIINYIEKTTTSYNYNNLEWFETIYDSKIRCVNKLIEIVEND